jgi:transposase
MTTEGVLVKSAAEQRVEAHYGRPIAEVLADFYQIHRYSQAAIAELCGVTRQTVVEWMQKWKIPTGYNRGEAEG